MKKVNLVDFKFYEDYAKEDEQYGYAYKGLFFKSLYTIVFVCLLICFVPLCYTKLVTLRGAAFTDNSTYIFAAVSMVFMSIGAVSIFAKGIIVRKAEDSYKKYVSAKYDSAMKHYSSFGNAIRRVIAIVLILLSLVLGAISSSDYGFYDDHFTAAFFV